MSSLKPGRALAVSMVLSGCTIAPHSDGVQTVDEVVATEQALLNKPVTVRGYLRFGDDSRNLWSERDAYSAIVRGLERGDLAPDDPQWHRCITLYEIREWREYLLSHTEKYVTVTGVLRLYPAKPGEISMGSCSDLGIEITSVR
jgi:hypothetical protein